MTSASLHSRRDLAGLLSQNIGIDKALDIVNVEADTLGVGEEITLDHALRILERVAAQPGLVGITARFAKSRIILRWGATPRA